MTQEASTQSELEQLTEATIAEVCIPALAVVVLQSGQTLLQRAFGLRDIERGLAATIDSQFAICSLTKSFTAAGLAMLVEEGKLDWDRPIHELQPKFRLQDPLASREITLRDILAHRSGLPRHDWVWLGGDRSREEMFAVLDQLPPNREFRSVFQYNNLLYMAAGMLAEHVSGMSWEEFTKLRLLHPLGMANCTFSVDDLRRAPDFVRPYVVVDNKPRAVQLYPINTTPAGGINASIGDMSQYLRFLLNRCTFDGIQLLESSSAALLQSPQMFVRTSEYAELGDAYYGFGLEVTRYRGERLVRHSGGWVGWGALLAMLPERDIGIVILTNRDYSPALDFLSFRIFDRLCGFPEAHWPARCSAKLEHDRLERWQARAVRRGKAPRGFLPPRSLGAYAGTFHHMGYGCVTIHHTDNQLRWRGLSLDVELEHRGADMFAFPDGPQEDVSDNYVSLSGVEVLFTADNVGQIDRFAIPLEPQVPDAVFVRR